MIIIDYNCVDAAGKIRVADIVAKLADHTLQQVADDLGLEVPTLSRALLEASQVIDRCWYLRTEK